MRGENISSGRNPTAKGLDDSTGSSRKSVAPPYEGIGKPEALRGDLEGFWSRRIDREHRLVYKIDGDSLLIAQCRRHY